LVRGGCRRLSLGGVVAAPAVAVAFAVSLGYYICFALL
jgi:hypothetical protein